MTIPPGSIGAREKLRAKVVAAVEAEVQRIGPDAFKGATLAREFAGKTASQATIYRWIQAALPAATDKLAMKIKLAALERSERVPEPAADAGREAVEALPIITTADIVGAGGVVEFVAKLQECIKTAEQIMAHGRTDEGKPRNVRALLAGSEHLRRSLETAMKMREMLRQDRDLDEMMKGIVDEVAKEAPACAERILRRISGILTLHGV